MGEVSFDLLRKIQAKEREPFLSKIPEDFYESSNKLLEECKNDPARVREYNNLSKIVRQITLRRIEKIFLGALNSVRGLDKPANMIRVEEEFYEKVLDLIRNFQVGQQEKEGTKEEKKTKLRALRDIATFVGLDGKTYGPFRENEEIIVPEEEEKTLIAMGLARRE